MSNAITWTNEQLQTHLAEWNTTIRDGNIVPITLCTANTYPEAYALLLPDNSTVALTLSQALVVNAWIQERASPQLRSDLAMTTRVDYTAASATEIMRDMWKEYAALPSSASDTMQVEMTGANGEKYAGTLYRVVAKEQEEK